jgi:hypothetical protein
MIAADAPVSQRFQADLTAALERALRAPE